MTNIFGYGWGEIQRAQQGGSLSRPITSEARHVTWTEQDQRYLDELGSIEALEKAGWHGIADRAKQLQAKPNDHHPIDQQ